MYQNAGINTSPTVVYQANAAITAPAFLGFKANNSGKLVTPAAGDPVIGFALPSAGDVAAGGDLTLQVKDIGYAMSGAAVAVGDELQVDATGKVIKATAAKAIVGVALTAASATGKIISIMITHSGYVPAAST